MLAPRSLLIGLVLLGLTPLSCDRSRPPNVLMIVIDTLRADRVGVYGNRRGLTPFIDSVAARGVAFLNAYSVSSWTCPSVASLLTSRYPAQHHVISFVSKLPDDEITLAEKLEPLRYVSGGFSANFRLLQSLGYAQGFQFWQADVETGNGVPASVLRAQGLEWLDRAWQPSSGRPAFLYFQFMEPHAPYEPAEPFRSRFQTGNGDAAEVNQKLVGLRWHELTRADTALLESLYDGEVATVDEELRLLFDELERRGFLQNAIVIITADHGEEFWEHGNLSHGTTLYNESVHVPLIVQAPGAVAGRRIEENVSLVDVAPTVLDLVGFPPEPRFEGRSLAPLLRAEPAGNESQRRAPNSREPEDVLLQLEWQGYGFDTREHVSGIVRRDTKVLLRPNGLPEAYDLATDPGEKHANADGIAAQSDALMQTLAAATTDLVHRAGTASKADAIDQATREKLRALGYHF